MNPPACKNYKIVCLCVFVCVFSFKKVCEFEESRSTCETEFDAIVDKFQQEKNDLFNQKQEVTQEWFCLFSLPLFSHKIYQ